MITSVDLTEIYKLFVTGFGIGSLIGAIPFLIGYTANLMFKIIRL